MRLSISNIAWEEKYDEEMYEFIARNKYNGLEIAPTRLIKENPYSHIEEIQKIAKQLKEKYELNICSIQSIWYGKNEKIFESEEERRELLNYTKKAIDYASAINCGNIVFGCPKNRNIKNLKTDYEIAVEFFREIGNYAKQKNVCFSIEPNPTIYNTNFINTTKEAIELVKIIDNEGIKLNIDLGTIIQNDEDIEILREHTNLINHVHISEPNLEIIKERKIHNDLIDILKEENYQGYISIEMKKNNDIENVKQIIKYVKQIVERG